MEKKSSRAVVSVAFSHDDLDEVSEAARGAGMKTSEFIRESALRRAADRGRGATILGISGRGGLRGVGEDLTTGYRGVRVQSQRATETH